MKNSRLKTEPACPAKQDRLGPAGRNRRLKIVVFGLWSLVFSLLSIHCGYSTHSNLPAHLKRIYIPPFENKIDLTKETQRNVYFPLLEVKVRNAVVDRFQFDGSLKIAKEDKADLILKGILKNYERDVLRYTDNNDVLEYRVKIFVSLEMWDNTTQQVWWQEPSFVGEATYVTSGAQARSEDAAIKDAAEDLARRVVERTMENW